MTSRRRLAAGLLIALLTQGAAAMTEEEAYRLGSEAYLYGLPLVEMARTRYRMSEDPTNPFRIPPNTLFNVMRLSTHESRAVVAPNVDTLYTVAWLDLSAGPVVLEVPDMDDRYYSFQFMDFYTNTFDYVGRRKTGTKEGRFAIVGPNHADEPPAGTKVVRSPTPSVWMLGRTLVDGPEDMPKLYPLMQKYKLSAEIKPAAKSPLPQRDPAEPLSVFAVINAALAENPPPADEAATIARFGAIGVAPGRPFDAKSLDPLLASGLRRAVADVDRQTADLQARPGARANGWGTSPPSVGNYGKNYALRAAIAKTGLGANTLDESYYYRGDSDADGMPLTGLSRYVLRFDAKDIPPVNAFWSVTLYGPDRFLVDNPIKRYAIGDRTAGLKRGADGSIEIAIQHAAPGGERDANWLPAPAGPFALTLRAYEPKPEILDGRYAPPPIKRLP